MKKMMLSLIAMAMCANVMAQELNEQKQDVKPVDKEKVAQKRTDYMVEKYGLNEEQAAKLLELNQANVEKFRPMRGEFRRQPMKKIEDKAVEEMEQAPGRLEQAPEKMQKAPKKKEKAELKKLSAKKEMKPERREDFHKEREAYDNELQKIMTEEQFKAYKEDMQKRHHGQRSFRGPRQHRNHPNQ